MKWEKKPLTDFVWFQRGFDLPKDKFGNGEFPVVGSTSILGYHTEAKVKAPGIVTGRSGTIGQFQFLKSDFWPHNTTLWVKDFYGNDERFAFYLLHTLDFISLNGGGAVPSLNRNFLSSININVPPLPTQRKIAGILSAYDDLIENNLKRIKLLEEKALMEYRILYSSSKLTEFPIEDVWEIKYGKNLPQTKITEKGKYPVYGAAGRIGFYEEFNYEFPVALVTSRGNGSGLAHRTNQAAFVTNNSFAFVPKLDFSEVHFHLAEMILRDLELTQLRSGTAQPQLTIAGLIGVKLKLPNKEALIEFNKIVDPLFNLIHTLEKQNAKLREARDILLPKLMNGEIEV